MLKFSTGIRSLRAKLHQTKLLGQLQAEIERRVAESAPLKIVIGAGVSEPFTGERGTPYEGWLLTDISTLNALDGDEWAEMFPKGSIESILAEHVVEHWTEQQLRSFLKIVRPFLREGGRIRIAVPDGFHPSESFIDSVKPGGTGPGADDHKVLYNFQTLGQLVAEEGWDYELLEYFDEQQKFHARKWNEADGFITRSERFDPRNKEQPLSYTSLIVDLTPEKRR